MLATPNGKPGRAPDASERFRLVDPQADLVDRDVRRAVPARRRQLSDDVDHAVSEHRHPDRAGVDHTIGLLAPSELESQVTKTVLEDSVAGLNGVWHLISQVTDGSSSTIVQFERRLGRHRPRAERRQRPDRQDQERPYRVRIRRTDHQPCIDVEGLPIVTYAASAPGIDGRAIVLVHIDDDISREVAEREGGRRGQACIGGGVDREIRVSLDPEQLLALGVTAARVNDQVRADGNVDIGGGRGEDRAGPGTSDPHAGRRAARSPTWQPCRSRCRAAARSGSTNWEQ